MASSTAIQAHPGCRFYVAIEGIPQAVFAEASGLAVEMAVEEVEEGGNNEFVHRMPGRSKVSNLTLKRGISNSNEFLKWSLEVAQGKLTRRNLSVIVYNPDGTELMRWNYANAYPVKWTGPQFKSDDTANAIETLELAHEGLKVD
jgi:phage tail-like protein